MEEFPERSYETSNNRHKGTKSLRSNPFFVSWRLGGKIFLNVSYLIHQAPTVTPSTEAFNQAAGTNAMDKYITYSVIIPAYNEAACLSETLVYLKKTMASIDIPGEIIVADNNSSDQTPHIARQFGARVVFEPFNQISRARNAGGRAARGGYLIFLDADTFLSRDLLKTALSNLSRGCCGGGAVVDFYEPVKPLVRWAMGLWNRFSRSYGIAAGCFIYCLQQGFAETGGFTERVYAGEEFWFSRSLKSWGKRRGMIFKIISYPPIITSNRKLNWFKPMELFIILLMGAIPFAVRNRSLCAFWYKRPKL